MVRLDQAEEYLLLNARLVDRHRFAYHFRGGDREPVLAALRAYQNADGGFGNALEPDLRGPDSQPCTTELALTVLDAVDAMDDEMVLRALDFLESITTPDGGVPWVLPSARNHPRGPWWQVQENPAGSLNPTAGIAGLLHEHDLKHPWIERATAFCWQRIDAIVEASPYETRSLIGFLDQVPDRARAERAWERIGRLLLEGGHVALDPDAEGEVHFPLDFAPTPDTLARRLFADDLIERHLDAVAARQRADGGWGFSFESWTPITRPEWGGWVTVETLRTLRAYGRL